MLKALLLAILLYQAYLLFRPTQKLSDDNSTVSSNDADTIDIDYEDIE